MTPTRLLAPLRVTVCLGAAVVAILLLGPIPRLETMFDVPGLAMHVLAFYLVTAGLYAVAPRQRRADLAATAVAVAGMLEVARVVLGTGDGLFDLLADCLGVGAVYLPGVIEDFRYHVRRNPHLTFAEIRAADPRQSARSRTPAAVARRLFARPWTERADGPAT
jgi:hypothetical protein